jgi:hypothetical protein
MGTVLLPNLLLAPPLKHALLRRVLPVIIAVLGILAFLAFIYPRTRPLIFAFQVTAMASCLCSVPILVDALNEYESAVFRVAVESPLFLATLIFFRWMIGRPVFGLWIVYAGLSILLVEVGTAALMSGTDFSGNPTYQS